MNLVLHNWRVMNWAKFELFESDFANTYLSFLFCTKTFSFLMVLDIFFAISRDFLLSCKGF